MARHLTLRQIEAFKAVMEYGTVSRAAEMLNISQPAMSKLIAHLEMDTGLRLFDRIKGRLAPTRQGLRLHEEVEQIFAGVRQIERAADAIRREQQSLLMIGVMPALGGSFIQQATGSFLETHPGILCHITPLASHRVLERLEAKTLDVGLVSAMVDNPYVVLEPLIEHPLVCIMPPDHPLAGQQRITPHDLAGVAFVSFDNASYAGRKAAEILAAYEVAVDIVLIAGGAATLCEFVAAGSGVSLVHPLMAAGLEGRLAIRPFEPSIPYRFQIGRNAASRNARLVAAFIDEVRDKATSISETILGTA